MKIEKFFPSTEVRRWSGGKFPGEVLGSNQSNAAPSASIIKELFPTAPSGVYWILWNGTTPVKMYCEMDLEGGGWMMVLNYVHLGGTNPNLTVRTSNFPLLGSQYSFADESSSTGVDGTWGHASNSLMNQRNWTQYMFYGRSSGHSRVIHFRGNDTNIVSYIKTGSGSMAPHYANSSTNFNGSLRNNASIPLFVDNDRSGFSNQNDLAMTEFPIYGNSTIGNPRTHWGIKGQGTRWEVDDYPETQGAANGSAWSTIHRIFVR